MAIAFDAPSNSGIKVDVTIFSWSHTVTTGGGNRILLVGVSSQNPATPLRTVSGVTYNGVAMTQVDSDANESTVHSSLWRLVDPATGPNTVEVTLDGQSQRASGGACSFTGVDQSSPIEDGGTNVVTNPPGATSTSIILTTANGDWAVDTVSQVGVADEVPAVGAGQTERWAITYTNQRHHHGSTENSGPGTITMSWSVATAREWAHVAAALRPAAELVALERHYPRGIGRGVLRGAA